MGVVVANLQQDFERPLGRADAVEVGVGVPRLREKSFPFEYEGRSPVGVHAVGETTMVAYDWTTREARRIPDRWRRPMPSSRAFRRPGRRRAETSNGRPIRHERRRAGLLPDHRLGPAEWSRTWPR